MEKIASYFGVVGVFGLVGRLFGWWKGWGWWFLGCLVISFILFKVFVEKRDK